MFENLLNLVGGGDTRTLGMVGTGGFVLLVGVYFIRTFLEQQKRDRFSRILIEKTEGAQVRATSIILDAEARAVKSSGREEKRPLDLLNWFSIKRDLRRAGLPVFPPLVYLAAAIVSWLVAAIVIAAPIFSDVLVAAAIYPSVFFLVRKSLLGMLIENRRMKMMQQLILFIESVQRSVSVGTSPDEAVQEAVRETDKPLRENLIAIKDLLDLGYDFIDAITLAADRVNLAEFDIFVASLSAQSSTGGSIGEVLKEVVEIARSRMDLQKKIATMTAEGRFNALLLGSLPIGLEMYLRSAQASYFNALWTSNFGILLYFGTLGSAVFGAWLAMRIARVSL